MIVAVLALSVLVGVALGLLGGGGSILTVPLLTYVAGLQPKAAIATSLAVVGATSAFAAVDHARNRRVRWRTGLVFGSAGMAGAYVGGRLAHLVPGTWLLIGFAVMMAVTAVAMIRGRRGREVPTHSAGLPVIVVEGVVVGFVTGMVGAGGGFLVVPALVLIGGLPMDVAVGTSLVVIAMKSFAGLAGYLHDVEVQWPLAIAVTAAAVLGSIVGARFAGRVDNDVLRRTFGWFVAVMAAFVLVHELQTTALAAAGRYGVAMALIVAASAATRHVHARRQARGKAHRSLSVHDDDVRTSRRAHSHAVRIDNHH